MKKYLIFLCAMLLVFGMAVSAMALTYEEGQAQSLYAITGISGTDTYFDIGAEAVHLTDVTNGTASAFLLFELTDNAAINSFGIYSFEVDDNGISVIDTLQVFDASASDDSSATIEFNLEEGYAFIWGAQGTTADIGTTFGFYLETPMTTTLYSHAALNDDTYDHMLMFDTYGNNVDALQTSEVVVAFEDMLGFFPVTDWDFNDMVVGVTGVAPTHTPEPATMLLFGSGLIGLAVLGRKRFFKNS